MKFILLFILLLLILILINNIYTKERFNIQTGVPKAFGEVQPAYPMCLFSNDCFPGYYFRSWRNTKFCA
jgi:hypothetical protein